MTFQKVTQSRAYSRISVEGVTRILQWTTVALQVHEAPQRSHQGIRCDVTVHREEIHERVQAELNTVDQEEPGQTYPAPARRRALGLSSNENR